MTIAVVLPGGGSVGHGVLLSDGEAVGTVLDRQPRINTSGELP